MYLIQLIFNNSFLHNHKFINFQDYEMNYIVREENY